MIRKSSKGLIGCCIRNNIIDEKDRAVYEYGMELLISTVFSTMLLLIIGIVLQRFWYTIFLMIPFYNIRVYAGGIHAENYTKCFLSFSLGFLLILLSTDFLVQYGFENIIMYMSFFSMIVICMLSPVEDHSRPLSKQERKSYSRKASISAIVYEVLAQVVYLVWQPVEIVFVAAAINAVMLVLYAGILKNKLIGYRTSSV